MTTFKQSLTFFMLMSCWALMVKPMLVLAHAEPVYLSPAPNSTLNTPPKEVRIVFSEKLLATTVIKVFDKSQKQVDNKDGKIDPADARSQTYVVGLPALGDGVYTVEWRSLAVDGHTESGKFTFTLKLAPTALPPSPSPSPTPSQSPISANAASTTPQPSIAPTLAPSPVPVIATSPVAIATATSSASPRQPVNLIPIWVWVFMGLGAGGILAIVIWAARRKT